MEKLANMSLMVVPIDVDPGSGLLAKFSIPVPPVAVSAIRALIAAPPPSLSARYIMNMNPAP